mmetsp:Transcript_3134/g.7657  ORF Transcript_3134/g.7657 Transcript_3134/m.7657 type:complete len:335 (+) Transcript_3134:52-1056(+)
MAPSSSSSSSTSVVFLLLVFLLALASTLRPAGAQVLLPPGVALVDDGVFEAMADWFDEAQGEEGKDLYSVDGAPLDLEGGFVIWVSRAVEQDLDKKEWKNFHNCEFTSLLPKNGYADEEEAGGGRVLFEDDREWIENGTSVAIRSFDGYTVARKNKANNAKTNKRNRTFVTEKIGKKMDVLSTVGWAKHCHFTMRTDTLDYVRSVQHNAGRGYHTLHQHTYRGWKSLGGDGGPLVDSCECTRRAGKNNGCKSEECLALAINTGVRCDNCGKACNACWKADACDAETWRQWLSFKANLTSGNGGGGPMELPQSVAACAECLGVDYQLQLTLASLF